MSLSVFKQKHFFFHATKLYLGQKFKLINQRFFCESRISVKKKMFFGPEKQKISLNNDILGSNKLPLIKGNIFSVYYRFQIAATA